MWLVKLQMQSVVPIALSKKVSTPGMSNNYHYHRKLSIKS